MEARSPSPERSGRDSEVGTLWRDVSNPLGAGETSPDDSPSTEDGVRAPPGLPDPGLPGRVVVARHRDAPARLRRAEAGRRGPPAGGGGAPARAGPGPPGGAARAAARADTLASAGRPDP